MGKDAGRDVVQGYINVFLLQIQTRAQSLRLPQSFLYSTDTELKSALQVFSGKP